MKGGRPGAIKGERPALRHSAEPTKESGPGERPSRLRHRRRRGHRFQQNTSRQRCIKGEQPGGIKGVLRRQQGRAPSERLGVLHQVWPEEARPLNKWAEPAPVTNLFSAHPWGHNHIVHIGHGQASSGKSSLALLTRHDAQPETTGIVLCNIHPV